MHSRKTWRTKVLAAAIALSALALGACGAGNERSDGKTQITFSYLWTGKEDKAMQKIISEFNTSQDKIVVKGVSNPDQQAQLAAMSGAKGTFDISDSFGSTTGAFAAKGVIEPLDSFIDADKYDTADFLGPAMAQSRYDGKTYALPIAVHSIMMLYNKDLLAKAGVSEPPKTTGEWAAAIAKTTKIENGKISQLGWANPDLTTLGYTFGGGWFDDKGKPTPDAPGNVAAANFYVTNVAQKYGAADVQKFTSGFGEYASPQNPFFQGKVAMVTDGEWMSAFIKEFAPNLEWGVAPVPYPDGKPELAGTTQLTSSTLFIPRNSQHKQEAWEFMKFLVEKKAMLDFSYALANMPSRSSLLDDPKYKDLPNFDAWLKSLKSKNVKSVDSLPFTQEYTADMQTAFDGIVRVTKKPEDALAAVAQKASKYGS